MSIFPACKPFKYQPFNSFFMMSETNASESPIGPRTNCYCWPSLCWRGEGILRGNLALGLPEKKKWEAWEEICVIVPSSVSLHWGSEKRWYALQSQSRLEIADFKRAVTATGMSISNIACIYLGHGFHQKCQLRRMLFNERLMLHS